jgi:alkylated DNA repair dioxygenase AlkB
VVHAGTVPLPESDPDPSVIRIDDGVAVERVELDPVSWVDVARGWLVGADELMSALLEGVAWQTSRLFRYDHWVEERRLGSFWRPGTPLPHPAVADAHRWLQHRYHVQFDGFSLMQYRDGQDGQAFHRDTDMRWLDDTVIAVLSLGAARPWLLRSRPAAAAGWRPVAAARDLAPASGDLLVMGGGCQAGWEHSVPYQLRTHIGPRISLQWRYTSRHGRMFMGSPYRAALTYGRGR